MRFALGCLAVLWTALAARSAHADERAFSVAWQAPPECPDANALERYVSQTVGEAGQGPLSVRATGTTTKTADGKYVAALQLDTGAAQPSVRSLDGRDCEAVAQAVALLIALAVRAHAAPVVEAPKPPIPPTKPAPPTSAPPAGPSPTAPARPFFALGPVLDVGTLPAPSPGLGLSVGVHWPALRAELGAAHFAAHSATVAGGPDKGAELSLLTFGGRACLPWGSNAWHLGPCLGAGGSRLHGAGFGARTPKEGTAWAVELSGGALASWDISSAISLGLSAAAALPLSRPEFVIDDAGPVHRREPASARVALGLDIYF